MVHVNYSKILFDSFYTFISGKLFDLKNAQCRLQCATECSSKTTLRDQLIEIVTTNLVFIDLYLSQCSIKNDSL